MVVGTVVGTEGGNDGGKDGGKVVRIEGGKDRH
jgi:hypothetical protein